ncbi:MAG TPA: ATP-dependent helicase HrpB [Acidobacteriota bacterium]
MINLSPISPISEGLPIDPFLPQIVSALAAGSNLVIEAPPGAGKTTRVPPALLDGLRDIGQIVVLEPRRIAARLAARRVAAERGEPVGESVGYQVRFEEALGPKTRLRFVTEGILIRQLLASPTLPGVGAVVLDEFHERHLYGDLALAWLRRLQLGPRPELKLVAMSATLAAAPIAGYLGGAPTLEIAGRRFEVAIEHLTRADSRPLAGQVAAAVRRLLGQGLDGDILVFLPGAAEIVRARDACRPLARQEQLELTVLHGDLPAAEQDRALARRERRKLILSTNVAESSITIDGVVAVIDSGLARRVEHAPWSGLPTSRIARISRASAAQRAGRAGRLGPGRCLRLYTKQEHDAQPEFETPEVQRADLAEAVLFLHGLGVADPESLGWLEAPGASALRGAEELLRLLGAFDAAGCLSEVGRAMLRFPAHPRLARILVEAERRGVAARAALVAALLSERDIALGRRFAPGAPVTTRPSQAGHGSDLLADLELYELAHSGAGRRSDLGLDPGAVQAVTRAARQLGRWLRPRGAAAADPETELQLCLLTGYPDRVARRQRGLELALAAGGTATLSERSAARDAELLIAIDAEQKSGRQRGVLVRAASAIEPEWLLELFPESIREQVEARWNPALERVEVARRLLYLSLILEESRDPAAGGEAAERVLAEAALARGPRAFTSPEALDRWLARLELLARAVPESGSAVPQPRQLDELLESLCHGRRSFAELRAANLLGALQAQLAPQQRQMLAKLAPERLRLPGGRTVEVHYQAGQPPWIASRLQDFFGQATSPTIAQGRVPLVVHLLAPSGRPVQVTTDLAGFWERTYPALRKELSRRYPKHAWPEDGRSAKPPSRRR